MTTHIGIVDKVPVGTDLVEDSSGKLHANEEQIGFSESRKKVVTLDPINQPGAGSVVGGQKVTFRINPNTIHAVPKDADLVFNVRCYPTDGVTFTPGDNIEANSIMNWIDTIEIKADPGSVPSQILYGEALWADFGAHSSWDELRKYTGGKMVGRQHTAAASRWTVDTGASQLYRLPLHSSILQKIDLDNMSQPTIIEIMFKSQDQIERAKVGAVQFEWNAAGLQLHLTYDEDKLVSEQREMALLKAPEQVNYSSYLVQSRQLNLTVNNDFTIPIDIMNMNCAYMYLFIRPNTPASGGTSGADMEDGIQALGATLNPDTRVNVLASNGTSLIGGPRHPALLRADERFTGSTSFNSEQDTWFGCIPFCFSKDPLKSLAGINNGFHRFDQPATIQITNPQIATGTYNVDLYMCVYREMDLKKGVYSQKF